MSETYPVNLAFDRFDRHDDWRCGITHEQKAWLDEQVGDNVQNKDLWGEGHGRWIYLGSEYSKKIGRCLVRLSFRDPKDAIMFKLAWGGTI